MGSDNELYVKFENNYYKVEPIVWVVDDRNRTTLKIITDSIIDIGPFCDINPPMQSNFTAYAYNNIKSIIRNMADRALGKLRPQHCKSGDVSRFGAYFEINSYSIYDVTIPIYETSGFLHRAASFKGIINDPPLKTITDYAKARGVTAFKTDYGIEYGRYWFYEPGGPRGAREGFNIHSRAIGCALQAFIDDIY